MSDVNVQKLLSINEHDLETELASCSSLYYMFSELALEAEQLYNESTTILERHELELANKFKQEYSPRGKTDKLMESDIKRMFRGDEQWNQLKKEENRLYMNFKKMEKAAKAFEMKSQNCMSINKRQLYKAGKGMDDV